MSITPREIVYRTLNFASPPRAPRQLWVLPWANLHYPEEVARIHNDFPDDIIFADPHLKEKPKTSGDMWNVGRFIDEWGCTFENVQVGIQGEVKNPLIKDWEEDRKKVRFPREWLTVDIDAVNRDIEMTDRFVLAGCCARPFERLQFLRGTEQLFIDLLDPPAGLRDFLRQLHNFYCELLELWAQKTQVDALFFMDDWGSQNAVLINPELWKEIFKPLYRDYIEIAHSYGKKAFMHSDGYILPIFPDLIELGLDAINSQLFCMGVENLRAFAGKITFWGEIDRQHLLPHGTRDEIEKAVKTVYDNLWHEGGCIAQCEFGPGAKPENVYQVFLSWQLLTS